MLSCIPGPKPAEQDGQAEKKEESQPNFSPSSLEVFKQKAAEVTKSFEERHEFAVAQMNVAGDPFAGNFLPEDHAKWKEIPVFQWFAKARVERAQFYDDVFKTAVKQGAKQVVTLFNEDLDTTWIRLKLGLYGMMKLPVYLVVKKDTGKQQKAMIECLKARYGIENLHIVETETSDQACVKTIVKAVDVSLDTCFSWLQGAWTPPPEAMSMLKTLMEQFPKVWFTTSFLSPDSIKQTQTWGKAQLENIAKEKDTPGIEAQRWMYKSLEHMKFGYTNDNFDILLGADKRFGVVKEKKDQSTEMKLYCTEKETWIQELTEEEQKAMEEAAKVVVPDTAIWVAQVRLDAGCDKLIGSLLPEGSEIWRKIPMYNLYKTGLEMRQYFGDRACRLAVKQGAEQILELGSGLSTRAARLKDLGVPFYECDMGEWFEDKCKTMQEKYELKDYHYKQINYITDDAIKALDIPAKKTVVIWEGNSMYIPRDLVLSVMPKILNHFEDVWIACDYFLGEDSIKPMKGWAASMDVSTNLMDRKFGSVVKLWISWFNESEVMSLVGAERPMKPIAARPLIGQGSDSMTALYTTSKKDWPAEDADIIEIVKDEPLKEWAKANTGPYDC